MRVEIGRNVLIGARVLITDHDHEFLDRSTPPVKSPVLICRPVKIEDEVWIGEGVVVLKGTTIGRRSVVGANSVVTHDIPPYSIAAGVPARVIGRVNLDDPPSGRPGPGG